MRRLKVDGLLRNLLTNFGMLPNTVYNMSLDADQVVCIGKPFAKERSAITFEGEEYHPLALDKLIEVAGKPANSLTLSEVETGSEFYVFNMVLRAFLGNDGTFYTPNGINETCAYDSLKEAYVAVSLFGNSKHIDTFRIYEKVKCSYFNEHIVEASLIPQKTDEVKVIKPSNTCTLYRVIETAKLMMEEGYVPAYEHVRLKSEGVDKYMNMSDTELRLIPSEEYDDLIQHFSDIKVQTSLEEAPICIRDFRRPHVA